MTNRTDAISTDAMAEDDEKDREQNESRRRLRSKNLTMLFALGGLAVLFYVVAIVRMGGG